MTVGDGIVSREAPEVIDAHQIVQSEILLHPIQPPAESVLLHALPVVNGITPQLAVLGEAVRRASRYHGGIVILIQQELIGGTPYIHAVVGHVDGHVPDDGDALFMGVVIDRTPLLHERVLDPFPESALRLQFRSVFPGGCDVLVARLPLGPRTVSVVYLQRHEQRIILQPLGIFAAERTEGTIGREPGVGFTQKGIAGVEQPSVVHSGAVPTDFIQILFCQQFFFVQNIRVNKVGIAGDGGRGLVGAVAVGGGIERQYLPALLTAFIQEIDEVKGTASEGADSVGRGQAAYRHENAAFVGKSEVFSGVAHDHAPFTCGRKRTALLYENIITFAMHGVNRFTVVCCRSAGKNACVFRGNSWW